MLNENKKSLFGSLSLFVCALVWGLAFVAQRTATGHVNAVSFNGIRYAEATIVLAIVIFVFDLVRKKTGKSVTKFNKDTLIGGVICGVALIAASNTQQYGLGASDASVGKAGFITVLYIVIVPILELFLQKKPTILCRFAILIAVVGFYLISSGDSFAPSSGDVMFLLCSISFSFQMVFIGYYSQMVDPLKLTLVQFLTCTLISLPLMGIFGFPPAEQVAKSGLSLLYVGVVSAGVGITLQSVGQRYVDASAATLIMSLESILGMIFGMIILDETHTVEELVGCLMVFVAIFLAVFRLPKGMLKFDKNKFDLTKRRMVK